ncbi:hypothetical protein V8G54_012096 [Vigna mungo]|uniref:Uncharacterized protein n=1 Tax=Vigna mungo TaxID=3915 RepID=A0AAQ3NSI2_VIGMU
MVKSLEVTPLTGEELACALRSRRFVRRRLMVPLERRAASVIVEIKVIEMRAFHGITGLGFAVSEPLDSAIVVSAFPRMRKASNGEIAEERQHSPTRHLFIPSPYENKSFHFKWLFDQSGLLQI